MQPIILLSGYYATRYPIIWYYATRYPIIWYYATRYPIIWVLWNPLFYYLGTMQPVIILFGYYATRYSIIWYYATRYSIIWVLCNPLFVVFWVLRVPIPMAVVLPNPCVGIRMYWKNTSFAHLITFRTGVPSNGNYSGDSPQAAATASS